MSKWLLTFFATLVASYMVYGCDVPVIDLALVIENDRTFGGLLTSLADSSHLLFDRLNNTASRVGVGLFGDKNSETPSSDASHVCRRTACPLTDDSKEFSENIREGEFWDADGVQRDSFHGVIGTLRDDSFDWRELSPGKNSESTVDARVVVLVTGTFPHHARDGTLDPDRTYKHYPIQPELFYETQICQSMDYPSEERFISELKEQGVHLIILVKGEIERDYWVSIVEKLDETEDVVVIIGDDQQDQLASLLTSVENVLSTWCVDPKEATFKKHNLESATSTRAPKAEYTSAQIDEEELTQEHLSSGLAIGGHRVTIPTTPPNCPAEPSECITEESTLPHTTPETSDCIPPHKTTESVSAMYRARINVLVEFLG